MPKVDEVHMTKEEFESRLQWSFLGGTVNTAKGVHALLLKAAGDHYACGRDEISSAFRIFARDYEVKVVKPQSAELQKFIDGKK